ncbi:arsenate reductase [Parvibium lacunae]|uniref:Arsenate reductase n=1 Tax=Parvibium lacunae TaxID=1888893 RepID=A0A368L7G5_9BURK|nr:arsenate reductase [Parvibium lacunae]RCS59557.1 arsenate reductase [Parvibium lacunae]
MTSIQLFGIPNCGSVKKARSWLDARQLDYTFHDFKKQGLDSATLDAWLKQVDWTRLLNKKGTTWRNLDVATQAQADTLAGARALMLQATSVIKRPVLVTGQKILVGFDDSEYAAILK